MAGIDIQNKVKSCLAKAGIKTGDGTSLVCLIQKNRGSGDPLTPPTESPANILLVNAIARNYETKLIDNGLIRGGDIQLVSDGDIEIKQNDEIDINGTVWAVISVIVKKPANVPLAYISQLRRQ